MTRDEFIKEARSIHGNDYEYDKVPDTEIYTTNHIDVYCNKCKEYFRVKVWAHIRGKSRHYKCFTRPQTLNTESFIAKAVKVHGDKFGYDRVNYVDSLTNVTILCKACGEYYEQRPVYHLGGKGHGMCKLNNRGHDRDYFISKAVGVHGDNYGYDRVNYINYVTPVEILCKKCNTYYLQKPIQHFKPIPFFGGEKSFIYTKESDAFKNTLAETHNIPLIRISYWYISSLQDVLNNKLRMYVKYKRDGMYFKNFLEYAKHFGLDGDAKSIDHKQYLFKLV